LLAQGQPVGLLHWRSAPGGAGAFDEPTQLLAQSVADGLALTWTNLSLREALRQEAIRDPLTGLYNRRFMEESLLREMRRAQRGGQTVAVILLDVDRFKQVNDRFGHEAGDMLLRALGTLLQASSRGSDIACRYGGEEFVLILPETSLETAQQRAEQIREKFRSLKVAVQPDEAPTTSASLGVAGYPLHSDSPEGLLRAADAALYEAKRAGRNRTRVAGKT
jgi:diguanylate cyclase (GGDEF)-like protein